MTQPIFFECSYPSAQENLAFEQWYFEHFETPALRLWISPPSVIIGKHQTAVAEANVKFCVENDIPILRRISGGGTVFHDPGNINFSFFRPVNDAEPINYVHNLEIIRSALHSLGYPVEINDRHDLVLDGFKISGNAQHVRKQKALHHGTILYDTSIETLRKAIKRSNGIVDHRGVKSVRSTSKNLRAFHDLGSISEFYPLLQEAISKILSETKSPMKPGQDEMEKMLNERYRTEEWNYGYGPKYTLRNSVNINHASITATLSVERGGEIQELQFNPLIKPHASLKTALLGEKHFPGRIKNVLSGLEGLELEPLELF